MFDCFFSLPSGNDNALSVQPSDAGTSRLSDRTVSLLRLIARREQELAELRAELSGELLAGGMAVAGEA